MVIEENYLIEFLIEKDNLDLFFVYLMCLLIEGKWWMCFEILFLCSVMEGWSMEDSNICIFLWLIIIGCL